MAQGGRAGQADPEAPDALLPVEIAFLARHGVGPDVLGQAADLARRAGTTADRALLAAGLLSAPLFYECLARHLGVPYLAAPLPVAEGVTLDHALAAEMVPLAPNALGYTIALAPRGATLAAVLRHFSAERWAGSDRVVITTPQRLAALVRRHHRDAIHREAAHALPDWNPRLSARTGLTLGQRACLFGLGFAIAVGLGWEPLSTLEAVCLALSALFLAMVGVRLAATLAALRPDARPALPDPADWPVYTVVVALYREARIVPGLVAALSRLDYPSTALDIKIVLEDGDADTLEALHREDLADRFDVLLAPAGAPRTKPRALNVALRFARGRFVVVFDAEDEPEPGQLKEAVRRFHAAGPRLGCLQARLAIDNGADGWLARLFALEYAALFDVVNPGLARLGLPIALGGTSNHFRVEALRRVNGWDAWNVTEDIDLGLRLARFGFDVGVLGSTTFEEAPFRLKPWLGQRQRWMKGWMVTFQTHTRDPGRLFAELGLRGGIAALATLCGTIATALLGPVFAVALVADAAFGPLLNPRTPGDRAWVTLVAVTAAGGALSLLLPVLAALRRRPALGASAAWLLAMPAYLALMSLASWRALAEVAGRPHSWTKTEHGLSRRRPVRS